MKSKSVKKSKTCKKCENCESEQSCVTCTRSLNNTKCEKCFIDIFREKKLYCENSVEYQYLSCKVSCNFKLTHVCNEEITP